MEEGLLADVPGNPRSNLIEINDDLAHVVNVLAAGGYGVWVVGGAIRDALLGKNPTDFDICTTAVPEEIVESFENTIPTGIQFGTVTVCSGDSYFQVTTLRTESSYGDGRRPDEVEWGDSLSIDLSRRDFTMNSMAYDCARKLLHDPYGGEEDLKRGLLCAVGDPQHRLSEDGLRVIRAYRFMDRGNSGIWPPNEALSAALIDNRSMILMSSAERIWPELRQIISGENASTVLSRMYRDGILGTLTGTSFPINAFEEIDKTPCDTHVRLALLFQSHSIKELTSTLKKLKMSNDDIKRTKHLRFLIDNIPSNNELRIYRTVIGDEVKTHISLIKSKNGDVSMMEKSLDYPVNVKCIIDGKWLMKRTNLEPGNKLGRLKEWLHRIQIERNLKHESEIEAVLCTIPWQHGDPNEWPKMQWP
ncbi:MAG: CCA tRNA nucleotidyltransferase [Candidatus Poseidoniaceae archaeon]|jgi:tRNA nucleotidyltransferase (CCA-adding enzyme)|nr:CCA tRNA nucleotidyltransferase [Candidatus Poseidoniaceae archaeon]